MNWPQNPVQPAMTEVAITDAKKPEVANSDSTTSNANLAGRWRWCLTFGYFFVADLFLINGALFLNSDQASIALGVPLSQCSLVAMWAVASRWNLVVRFGLTILNTLFCWYTMTHIFFWGIGDPTSAAWAIALCAQVLMLVFATHVFMVTRNGISSETPESAFRLQSYVSFDLRTLMLWTTTFAIGFGFIQWGRIRFGWSGSIARWPHVEGMPLIGFFNAAIASLMAWVPQTSRWLRRTFRLLIAASVVCLMSLALPGVITLATEAGNLNLSESFCLAVSQGAHLLLALLLLSGPISHPSGRLTKTPKS